MRVLVCGGRDFEDNTSLVNTLNALHEMDGITCVITGGAKGADYLAHRWARIKGLLCEVYPAKWHRYGARAGMLRNQQMLEEGKPDMVVAFPGGRGTADMVQRAIDAGLDRLIVESV